jgi:hypothetical protein
MICQRCGASKKYMGNGMVMMTCYLCDEQGRLLPVDAEHKIEDTKTPAALDRRSQSYKKAINDIMELHPLLSRDDAVKLFDKEYSK